MAVKCQRVINWIKEWAPSELAEDGDRIGLLVGSPESEIERILVTLEVTQRVVAEAIEKNVQLIVSHHPLFRNPLTHFRFNEYPSSMIVDLIRHGISVYVAHTNLDAAPGGVNDILAHGLGLIDVDLLFPSKEYKLYKLAVFVPKGYESRVRDAVCGAGAGWIGKYSDCSFQTEGWGTFRPLTGARPFVGEIEKLEKVREVRLETIVPENILKRVIRAMEEAHPYEEVAYDVYPLHNEGMRYGLGRVGKLPEEVTLGRFCEIVKKFLNTGTLRVVGRLDQVVSKVALCGGSGMALFNYAVRSGADVYLTGDVKHHEALSAYEHGINVVDAGHYETERLVVPVVAEYLEKKAKEANQVLEIKVSEVCTNPFIFV